MKKCSVTALLIAVCFSLVVACSSSGSKSSTNGGGSSTTTATPPSGGDAAATGLARAKQYLASRKTEPTSIAGLTQLPKAPKAGLKVTLLSCPLPTCTPLNGAFTDAAKALGWIPTVITYNVATPGAAVQQAITSGANMIASLSIQLNQITPQVAEMRTKNIPWFEIYTYDPVQGAKNWLFAELQTTPSSAYLGKLGGAWMIADSGGNANVAFVRLPIYPGPIAIGAAVKDELSADCPRCTYSNIDLSVDQLSKGQGASTIVAYLQSHPSINYVETSFANPLDAGIVAALKTAGLSGKVKVLTGLSDTAQMAEIAAGTEAAAVVLPEQYIMWCMVDAMARQSLGVLDKAALDATADGLAFIVDTPAAASAQIAKNNGSWPGPDNYEDQFKTLWKVS